MTEEDRKQRNDLSRNAAKHHGEPWTSEETEILAELWDRTEESLEEIAALLGRTVEACRQKFYYPNGQQRVVAPPRAYWSVGFCSFCGRYTDVRTDGSVSRCEECQCMS